MFKSMCFMDNDCIKHNVNKAKTKRNICNIIKFSSSENHLIINYKIIFYLLVFF